MFEADVTSSNPRSPLLCGHVKKKKKKTSYNLLAKSKVKYAFQITSRKISVIKIPIFLQTILL